ncbi:MAG: hypothetical protein EXR58_04710 [Chloroflexi bacterium]|nr:hypothetical protein [Chloroflexota bacterium]
MRSRTALERAGAATLLGAAWLIAGCASTGGAPDLGALGGGSAPSAPEGPLSSQSAGTVLTADELFNVYQAAMTNYVDRVDPAKLIRGAVAGIRTGANSAGLLPVESALVDLASLELSDDPQRDWMQFQGPYDALLRKLGPRIDISVVSQEAARGMLASVGDPLTEYIDRQRLDMMQSPDYSGVGLVLATPLGGGRPFVRAIVAGSGGEAAGVKVGDTIRAVDGKVLAGADVYQALEKISGPLGSRVALTLAGASNGVEHVAQVPRTRARAAAITTSTRNGSLYIQMSAFDPGAADAVRRVLVEATASGARGCILDLRGNGEGGIREAVNVASLYLGEQTIAQQEDRTGRRSVLQGTGLPLTPRLPTVVIIDRATAGPAELVAAAWRDYGVATIVGTPTAGRLGTTTLVPLADGSAAEITAGRFLSPSGARLLGDGVQPDVVVDLDPKELAAGTDLQFDRALALLG